MNKKWQLWIFLSIYQVTSPSIFKYVYRAQWLNNDRMDSAIAPVRHNLSFLIYYVNCLYMNLLLVLEWININLLKLQPICQWLVLIKLPLQQS